MAKTTGLTIWLTGLSLAGKSSIASLLAAKLAATGRRVELLDDADWAETLNDGPGNNKAERNQLVRRLGGLATVLTRNDVICIVAALSPYREERDLLRRKIGRFVEIYVDAPTETLIDREISLEKEIARATKSEISEGRMQKALRGEISMIGITEPYETPQNPELTIETHKKSVDACCLQILQTLCEIGYFRPDEIETITGMRVKRFVKPSDAPMTPPKPRGPIMLVPKNSPLKAALLKNPGKIPDEIKKALKVTAAEIKAEKQAILQSMMEEKTPVKAEAKKKAEAPKSASKPAASEKVEKVEKTAEKKSADKKTADKKAPEKKPAEKKVEAKAEKTDKADKKAPAKADKADKQEKADKTAKKAAEKKPAEKKSSAKTDKADKADKKQVDKAVKAVKADKKADKKVTAKADDKKSDKKADKKAPAKADKADKQEKADKTAKKAAEKKPAEKKAPAKADKAEKAAKKQSDKADKADKKVKAGKKK